MRPRKPRNRLLSPFPNADAFANLRASVSSHNNGASAPGWEDPGKLVVLLAMLVADIESRQANRGTTHEAHPPPRSID